MIIISTIVGKNHLEEMEYPLGSRAEFKMQYLGAASKIIEWSQFFFQGKSFNSTVIQVYAPTTDAEGAEADKFCE